MDFDQLYPNRFIKAGEFKGKDVTLTIKAVRLEELESERGKKQKGIVAFEQTQKEWVLNRTNGESLKAMFGRETDAWIGKRVTLYPARMRDSFTDEDIFAIRVRGSPDIEADKSFAAKIGRKTVSMKVVRTGKSATRAAPAADPGMAPEDIEAARAAEAGEVLP